MSAPPQHQNWEQPGLERQPCEQPGLERAPSPTLIVNNDPSLSRTQDIKHPYAVLDQASHAYQYAPEPKGSQADPKKVLGLKVPVFWGVVIALVIILAAGIGGGVGAGLAASNKAKAANGNGNNPSQTNTTNSQGSPTETATSRASPAPVDGCPGINDTQLTGFDVGGNPLPLKGTVQTFNILCNTNYPAGADNGNPAIHDITRVYVPNLEECVNACAVWNRQYEMNTDAGIDTGERQFCRAATIVKEDANYCYLKNATGVNNTFGNPRVFTTAVLTNVF